MEPDFWVDLFDHDDMIGDPASAFNEQLIQRVKDLRVKKEWVQEQMAIALGVPLETYKKYESRTPLPHHLIERFALIVGRDVEYVVTGKSSTSLAATRARNRATPPPPKPRPKPKSVK